MIDNLKLPISIIKYKLNKFNGEEKFKMKPSDYEKTFLNNLKKNGFCIIENFYSKEKCNELIKIIDEKLLDSSINIFEDKYKSDQRIFFSEKLSDKINQYFTDDLIIKIGKLYTKYQIKPGFTLANKVSFKPNNLGSGGGWHKDAYYPQYKSILYLNDVNFKNGPFQLLNQSNKLIKSIKNFNEIKKRIPTHKIF